MAWIGVAASVAGSLISSSMQGDAASSAASSQEAATAAATAEQRRQYDLTRKDLAPYRAAGGSAINRLSTLLGLSGSGNDSTPAYKHIYVSPDQAMAASGITDRPDGDRYVSDYTGASDTPGEGLVQVAVRDGSTPGSGVPQAGFGDLTKKFTLADFWDDPVTKASYQQGLDQGTKALTNIAGARGSLNSGATLKALTRFGTDYTGNQAAGSQARYVGDQTNIYNRLAGVAGTGQTAATNTAQFGQNTANTIGGMLTAQGNARGAAAISGANSMAGGIQNAANTFGNWWNGQQNKNNGNYSSSGTYQPFYDMSSSNYG